MIERPLTHANAVNSKTFKKNTNLIDIIISVKSFKLLKVLLYKSRCEMYQKEIINESGLSPNTAVPLLNKLTNYGILNENIIAGTKFYSIVEENSVVKQLKVLINVSNLYELTKDIRGDFELYLFGSAARGEDTNDSDIDLLIVANGDVKTLSKLKERIRDHLTDSLRREVNPIIFTNIEYSNLYNKEKAFYDSIEKDKIRVL